MSGTYLPLPLAPSGKFFNAEILGFDDNSYVYIAFVINRTIEKTYHEMYKKMKCSVTGESCIPDSILKHGLNCIVKLATPSKRRGGIYVRGKILEVNSTHVKCLLIDDFCELEVLKSQLFRTNKDVYSYNPFSLKCQLVELECFLGSPFLKQLYQEHLKKEGKSQLRMCVVEIQDYPTGDVPSVRITFPGSSQPFSSMLQELIPTFGKMLYPSPSGDVKVKLTHANEKGIISFQNWEGTQLIQVIEDVLAKFNPRTWTPKPILAPASFSWKTDYFTGEKTILIYKPLTDGKGYRVKIDRLLMDGKMMVSFVDYGLEGTVNWQDVYSARFIEQNLCFIPPQCRSFIIAGAFGTMNFDVESFWKGIPVDQTNIWIRLRDHGLNINTAFRGLITPEADIFIQPSPSHQCKRKLVSWGKERPCNLAIREASSLPVDNSNLEAQSSNQIVSQDMRRMFWVMDRLSKEIRNY